MGDEGWVSGPGRNRVKLGRVDAQGERKRLLSQVMSAVGDMEEVRRMGFAYEAQGRRQSSIVKIFRSRELEVRGMSRKDE